MLPILILVKFKKSDLIKFKILDLTKVKKSDFAKSNSFKIEILTSTAKEVFIYLQKAFIKASIFYYFDSKLHIRIRTNTLG